MLLALILSVCTFAVTNFFNRVKSKRVKRDRTESVALVVLAEMSDLIDALWILRALRSSYPETKVAVVTAPAYRSLVKGEGAEFIACPARGVRGLWRAASALRRGGYRSLADLQGSVRTFMLRVVVAVRTFFGSRTRVVDRARQSRKMMTRKFRKVLLPNTFSTERYRLTLERLGFKNLVLPVNPVGSVERDFYIPEQLTSVLGEKSGVWVGYAPFADTRGKMFPTSTSDKLVALLVERFERVVIFGGGDMERLFAEGVAEKYGPKVVPAVGILSPYEEMKLMGAVDLIISPDNPSLHLASLAGTPVLSIWGSTHPFAGGAGYGQNPEWQLQLDLPCRPCAVRGERGCIFGDRRCINGITPEMVAERAEQIVRELAN